jgi:hypothetical protein
MVVNARRDCSASLAQCTFLQASQVHFLRCSQKSSTRVTSPLLPPLSLLLLLLRLLYLFCCARRQA